MDEVPTSPKAILVQPAASALPCIYCRGTSAPSRKRPLLPCQPSPEVFPRSITVEGKAIAQHRSSDAQSDSRDMESAAAGEHHGPSTSVVQGSMPCDEVKGAPVAHYNIVTSGEYASAIKHKTTVSIAPGSPFSAAPPRHLISEVITGSDSSQELPQHYSDQQDFSSGLSQALSELQDYACHVDTYSPPAQPKPQPGGNNDNKVFCPDFQQFHHAFPDYDISNQSVRDSSIWVCASADADSFQYQNCFFDQYGTPAPSPWASWRQAAWDKSCQQQQQQQQICLSSSVQDTIAQGSTEWYPMPSKTMDNTTSIDDMSDDGFAAEASRWIVQNYGSHTSSAGELKYAHL